VPLATQWRLRVTRQAGIARAARTPRRILAPLATRDADGNVTGANLGPLIRRLILFEEVVVDSYGMPELPAIIEALGQEQFVELLESGAVLIRGDEWALGEVGNAGVLEGRGPLPPLSFSVAPLVTGLAFLGFLCL
jgi:hypothetical protein